MSVSRTDEYTVENDEFSAESLESRPAQSTSTAVKSGWDNASVLNAKTEYPTEFKFIDGKSQVVKFLDTNGPFAVYREHWLTNKKEGKRSYVCLGATCPLCIKLKDIPKDKRAFSIINLSAEGGPKRQMLIATPRCYSTLHTAEHSEKGPLTNNYWALSRSGEMAKVAFHASSVKPRDLMEDWNIDEAAAEAVVASATTFERSAIKETAWEELDSIANSLL